MEIAIISGKGGTGKSSISAAFAALSHHVVMADCDVDAANLHLLFQPEHEEEQPYIGGQYAVIDQYRCSACGMCETHCRFDAITHEHESFIIDNILCDGCELCARICPNKAIAMVVNDSSRLFSGTFRHGHMVYGSLAPGEENSGKLVNLVREKARNLATSHHYEQIIIDGPPGIGCPAISSITGVNTVIIVTEPSLSGLHDMKRTLELIQKFNIHLQVIINKYDLNNDVSAMIEDYCRKHNTPLAGKIPFDPRVTEAMVQQRTVTEWAPGAEVSKMIIKTWQTIVNHSVITGKNTAQMVPKNNLL